VSRRKLVDLILYVYPRAWRDRYGDEVRDLMHELRAGGDRSFLRGTFGLLLPAMGERVRSLRVAWKSLLFTGSIVGFAAAAIVVVNVVESVPSGPLAGERPISTAHTTATSSPSDSVSKSSAETNPGATKTPLVGPIPESAFNNEQPGGLDLSEVPDFIPALVGHQVVGFIPKAQLFPNSTPQTDQATPLAPNAPYHGPTATDIEKLYEESILTVYGPDLTTVIGHMYPNQDFVPMGETPPPYSPTQGQAVTAPTAPPPGAG
jgi:hypothetical protein